jgi:hypothetical protein
MHAEQAIKNGMWSYYYTLKNKVFPPWKRAESCASGSWLPDNEMIRAVGFPFPGGEARELLRASEKRRLNILNCVDVWGKWKPSRLSAASFVGKQFQCGIGRIERLIGIARVQIDSQKSRIIELPIRELECCHIILLVRIAVFRVSSSVEKFIWSISGRQPIWWQARQTKFDRDYWPWGNLSKRISSCSELTVNLEVIGPLETVPAGNYLLHIALDCLVSTRPCWRENSWRRVHPV